MIKIDFTEPTTVEWNKWRAKCAAEQIKHNAAIESGKKVKAKQQLYKGQKEQVYLHKDGPFHGKCAYCESRICHDQHGDIEHFRPKGAVTDADGKPIKVTINGTPQDHPGYYWLAYNWKNLLPACQLCNQPSTQRSQGNLIGKRDYFPLRLVNNFRAIHPGEETRESPLLVNPVLENPSDHMDLDSSGVFVDKSDRGDECIKTFGLNQRDLPNERAKVYQDVTSFLTLLSVQLQLDPNGLQAQTIAMLERLKKIKDGTENYTAAARLAIQNRRVRLQAELSLI